ncbi:class I SAM-dependent methyltransferase [Sphingomonas sp. ID0503]|uniref:class I SAM-dependent methyltransferase n=1 Tax=Sphingomonas sp. ID0503 TaxID=3399691 RepID=UPI003AFA6897
MERHTYERMAEIDGEHWWFTARRRIVAALIEAQVKPKPGARILEVGCGTGSNLAMLQRYGRVDAIEPDGPARALAERRSGLSIQSGLLPDGVTLEDGAYDLIVLLDVLEHIPDDAGTLDYLRSKLAPGGKLLLTVPASPWLWSAHDVIHHHQRRYTKDTLTRVVEGAGFRIRHRTHFNTILFPVVVALRAANKLLKREAADDAMPSPLVNRILNATFGAESHWVARRSLPFGVSLGVVAEPLIR